VQEDPFAELGLPALAELTDDDVRAAWRRIAAATHPDREDGGDPARFGAGAAAYALLRTSFGRGEALADLGAHQPHAATPARYRRARHAGQPRHAGIDRRLVLPAGGAALAAAAAVAAVGWTPATIGLVAGALTVTGWGLWRRAGRDR
jgi:curved DNA-binding protein CbpA